MRGQYLGFIKIEENNEEHKNILKEISNSTPFLGDLTHYTNKKDDKQITGNDYLVKSKEGIIGYVGLSPKVETNHGTTVSIYYAILKQFYGKGYGKLILNEISLILKTQDSVHLIMQMNMV